MVVYLNTYKVQVQYILKVCEGHSSKLSGWGDTRFLEEKKHIKLHALVFTEKIVIFI